MVGKGLGFLLVCILIEIGLAFPNGGPNDACVRPKTNQPNHGNASPQPISTNPYIIEASKDFYQPNDVITLTIRGPRQSFKGFFFQARHANTNEWIGNFEKGPDAKSYPECSAVTHTNNEPKDEVTLIWRAPPDREGSVYFIGTILQSYRTFWSDVVADVARQ